MITRWIRNLDCLSSGVVETAQRQVDFLIYPDFRPRKTQSISGVLPVGKNLIVYQVR
jgi:hypothetical protein